MARTHPHFPPSLLIVLWRVATRSSRNVNCRLSTMITPGESKATRGSGPWQASLVPFAAVASVRQAADLLGGEAIGDHVRCPGPQHSRTDRSLSVRFLPDAPGGFLVHSFAGDDPLLCRDYVRERLRLPGWRPKAPKECRLTSATEKCRIATALSIFQTAVNARGTIVEAYLKSRGT